MSEDRDRLLSLIQAIREEMKDADPVQYDLALHEMYLLTDNVPRMHDRIGRLEKGLQDIARHHGHVSINNGTATLDAFVKQILGDEE